jgi:hypothetical protein
MSRSGSFYPLNAFVLIQFNMRILHRNVVGGSATLSAKPFLGTWIPDNVLVFHTS